MPAYRESEVRWVRCLIVDPQGHEGVVVSASIAGLAAAPGGSPNSESVLGANFDADAGVQVLFNVDSSGQRAGFDLNGPAGPQASFCEGGGGKVVVGIVLQNCWNPIDQVPYSLNAFPFSWTGGHSFYVGIGTGAGFSVSFAASISMQVTCQQWLGFTGQACPSTNLNPPSISGTPSVGQTLNADHGTWDSVYTISYTYQWERCTSSSVTSCAPITSATGSTYTVVTGDKGNWLTVNVTATAQNASVSMRVQTPVGAVP
jgi:hypothetical protein